MAGLAHGSRSGGGGAGGGAGGGGRGAAGVAACKCELAVLGVNSPEFWEAVVPYNLASYGLPHLQQQVAVVSYEDGQPRPRSAPATVMRTEVVTYPSAMQRLLGMTVAVGLSKEQIGSAVVDSRGILLGLVFARTASSSGANKNARGSGDGGGRGGGGERWGHGRRRVGRRASRRGQTEASATAVPAAVVARFLEDIQRHGSYQGFPTLGIQWKRTESAALRRFTGMSAEQTGVVITSLNPTAALAALAQPLDVLAAVGGAAVGNDGTVEFRNGADSIHISYHVSQFRYAVVSGLVLTVLSAPFLEGAFGRSWAVRAPAQLLREWHNHPSRADEQVVVVAECQDMGPGSATDGYERRAVMYQRVVRCNGTHVVNMRHLVTLLADAMVAAATGGGGGARRINGRRHGGAAALQTSAAAPTEVATNANDEDSEGGRLVSELSDPAVVSAITAYDKDESDANHNDDGGGKGPPYDPENLVLELSNRMVLVLPLRRALEDTRAMLEEFEPRAYSFAISTRAKPLPSAAILAALNYPRTLANSGWEPRGEEQRPHLAGAGLREQATVTTTEAEHKDSAPRLAAAPRECCRVRTADRFTCCTTCHAHGEDALRPSLGACPRPATPPRSPFPDR
ncbi:trypsin family [Volvox carteri f. nagariensis]|uniref:Trypsin family n=1 Tax=Volvox carteri f. nagariensis TaxID=3068 RepID=D8TVQ2_VOLCA|nr:trypsin family [Volvox carteri f. nagariensis]EFJ48621.1 trypsin family [Volvox carteri f. nagariensis]|eukprot:XP_002950420.1 trypsin family [Volvox carteri f. nagariensis]